MKKRVENILGTTKDPKESWVDVFDRLNREGRVDFKSIMFIVGVLLDGSEKEK